MPRPTPSRERIAVPGIPPYRMNRRHDRAFESLLGGWPRPPDECVATIEALIDAHRASSKAIKGHTPTRVAATLMTVEQRLEHGDGLSPGVFDPWFGNTDVETHERLSELLVDPRLPPWVKAACVRERRLEIERLPTIDARHGLMTITSIYALLIWQRWSSRRDNRTLQWQFVLAVLDAAGVGTEGFRAHPGLLKRELDRTLAFAGAPLPYGEDAQCRNGSQSTSV
jgi:hypothetical protein